MVAYSRMTRAELTALAQSRSLDVKAFHSKSEQPIGLSYVNALTKADRSTRPTRPTRPEGEPFFDFFGLPGEMRNEIYRCLLRVPAPAQKCEPQIMVASKQANREASRIFFEENCFVIDIEVQVVKLHYMPLSGYYSPAADTGIHQLRFPEWLKKAAKLCVRVPRLAGFLTITDPAVNHVLYALCGHLRGDHKLQYVMLHDARPVRLSQLSAATVGSNLPAARMIYPLRMLDQVPRFEVRDPNGTTDLSHSGIFAGVPPWDRLAPALRLLDAVFRADGLFPRHSSAPGMIFMD